MASSFTGGATTWVGLVAFVLGIATVILLTTRFNWPAFVAIFVFSCVVGVASGLSPADVVGYVVNGFGQMLGYTGVVVLSGVIIGEFMDKTGAAATISRAVLRLVGKARAGLSLALSGYILAVPVMCVDTDFIILSPIAKGLSARSRIPVARAMLMLAAGAYTSFKLIPPSPGPLAVLTMFRADFAKTLLLSLVLSVPVFAVGTWWAGRYGRPSGECSSAAQPDKVEEPAPLLEDAPIADDIPATGPWRALLPVLIPILLIVTKSVADPLLAPADLFRSWLDFFGHPAIALPLGVGVVMSLNHRRGMKVMSGWINAAVSRASSILIIVGAGGALGAVLQQSGIGTALGQLVASSRIPGLLVPFLLALALKVTQGSSLVTLFTTPAIISPLLPSLGITPEIAALATYAGALAVVQVNDSLFWVVTRFAGLDVSEGYRGLTVLTLLQALVGLVVVYLLSLFA